MDVNTWVFIGAGFGVVVLLLVVVLLVRQRRRISPLTIHLSKPVLKPVSGRP